MILVKFGKSLKRAKFYVKIAVALEISARIDLKFIDIS